MLAKDMFIPFQINAIGSQSEPRNIKKNTVKGRLLGGSIG